MTTSTNLTTTKVSFNLHGNDSDTFVGLEERMDYFEGIQVAQKKVKIAFENADSSSRVKLIPSKIKYANKKDWSLVSLTDNKEEGNVGNKMHKAFPLPVMEFPLSEEVPTASEESSYCQKKKDATAKKIALLLKSSSNCQSKSYDSYAKLVPYVSPCILGITVIEFGDSDEAPADNPTTGSASDGSGKKKGRTITLTTDDMQKRKNDVKARTTLLLSLPDEHQLRFSKYKTAQELWAAILKTFSGNEATKKTKKNLLKQKSDLDTMSLDDLCNYLKVYESEVQKKSEPNSQNMAFISSAKHSSGNEEVNIASGSTASINVSTASANIGVAKKKTSIQGTDVAGFNKSKVECFNFHKMGYFARECRAPRSQDRERRDNYRQGSKVEEQAPKALMAIDGVGWDWSYMANDEENHALITDEETPTEFALMAKTSAESDDMSWTGLPKFKDDTVTDYSRPSPAIEECIMMRRNFKLSDDDNVLLRTPRQHNMYSIDLNNIVPHKDLTCLVAKAYADEGQLQFMGVEFEQDDLNQEFLTSLAPEWLMHTIVWRNMSDLDTMSLDDLYNHLKKKSEPNTQNMAFISSIKHSRGNDEVNTASVYTASSNVSTASANVATVSISQETAYDMEEMDIKWNMALLSMRADKFWKKKGKKIQ
nr:ribonuclease H-like domain-containing protein [Tanacetum cinerariifolium]